MISTTISDNIINNASVDALKILAKEFIKNIDLSYDYNDASKNEILNILITGKVKTKNDVDMDFIIKNIDGLCYGNIIKDNIEFVNINNIKSTVLIKFARIYSENEIRDVTEEISWINHPEIIKKS